MADVITVTANETSFAPYSEGTHAMACVDTIDLGEKVERFQDNPPRIVHKCALVFAGEERQAETGEPVTVSAEFTVSMYETAGLRRLLENWRGKTYTPEQAKAGVPLHKLVGQAALVTVEHKTSGRGRTYAKVRNVGPMPKGLPAPRVDDYTRPDFWAQRKAEYAADVAEFRGKQHASGDDDLPPPHDDENDLPF
jgi:hypothetical protein